MPKPYQIFKSAILDVSDYVHYGVKVDDIEQLLDKFIKPTKKSIYRLVDGFMSYEIRTLYEDDNDVIDLLDSVVKELDILLVNSRESKVIFN